MMEMFNLWRPTGRITMALLDAGIEYRPGEMREPIFRSLPK